MSYTREDFEEDFGPIDSWLTVTIEGIRIDYIEDIPSRSRPADSYYISIRAYRDDTPFPFHEESFVDCGPEDVDDVESWRIFLEEECQVVFKAIQAEADLWKESREHLEEKESAVRNGQNSGSSV